MGKRRRRTQGFGPLGIVEEEDAMRAIPGIAAPGCATSRKVRGPSRQSTHITPGTPCRSWISSSGHRSRPLHQESQVLEAFAEIDVHPGDRALDHLVMAGHQADHAIARAGFGDGRVGSLRLGGGWAGAWEWLARASRNTAQRPIRRSRAPNPARLKETGSSMQILAAGKVIMPEDAYSARSGNPRKSISRIRLKRKKRRLVSGGQGSVAAENLFLPAIAAAEDAFDLFPQFQAGERLEQQFGGGGA